MSPVLELNYVHVSWDIDLLKADMAFLTVLSLDWLRHTATRWKMNMVLHDVNDHFSSATCWIIYS